MAHVSMLPLSCHTLKHHPVSQAIVFQFQVKTHNFTKNNCNYIWRTHHDVYVWNAWYYTHSVLITTNIPHKTHLNYPRVLSIPAYIFTPTRTSFDTFWRIKLQLSERDVLQQIMLTFTYMKLDQLYRNKFNDVYKSPEQIMQSFALYVFFLQQYLYTINLGWTLASKNSICWWPLQTSDNFPIRYCSISGIKLGTISLGGE